MKKLIILIFISFFEQMLSQNPQEPIYINFAETFTNYPLDEGTMNGQNCMAFNSTTNLYFPSSFFYQLKEANRTFLFTTPDNTECLGVKIIGEDRNCGNPNLDFDRAEVVFKPERLAQHTSGNSFYKLKFYIPPGFKIENYTGEHNIFQIKTDDSPGGNISTLPQFLMQFMHEKSSTTVAKLQFNYGLEFDLGNCRGCLLGSNGKVDNLNSYDRCCYECTRRQKIEYNANYGWNEILFQIQWSEFAYGWMDIWLNGNHVNTSIPNGGHTFVGNNVYNENMFPLPGGNSRKYSNYMKFGQYRWGSSAINTIYFDYFYADKDTFNITDNFKTFIQNDENGIINMRENIKFKEIRDADEYILLFQNNGLSQYIGSNTTELSIDQLLNSDLNLSFYTNYQTNVRARFNKGFNGKYSTSKTISLNPDTKLAFPFCNKYDIHHNQNLTVEKINGADSYILFFKEVDNPTNQFYHTIPSSGYISVQTLFNSHPSLSTYKKFYVNVRARFQQYGMEGNYSEPCQVMFTPVEGFNRDSKYIFYPNPVNNEINLREIAGIKKIQLYDIYGNMIIDIEKVISKRIDVSHLKNGLYFFALSMENESFVYKLIKN